VREYLARGSSPTRVRSPNQSALVTADEFRSNE
jgi:hypothetical protein